MKLEELQLGFQETMFHVSENGQAQIDQKVIEQMMDPVSYTHLTLPTKA